MRQPNNTIINFWVFQLSIIACCFTNAKYSEAVENKEVKNTDVLLSESLDRARQLAQNTTIYRDTYGVPHVTGPTDASVVFGFTYARAEDEFQKIQKSLLSGMGRSAELIGPGGFPMDRPRLRR